MSPAHVLEPTYATIKQRLLDGAWAPGARLETARIADMVGVSMTPVRDSLSRLVGERLVDLRPGFGFHVPRLCVFELRDLLALNLALLRLAANRRVPAALADFRSESFNSAERTRTVFASIARASGNAALEDAIESLNDRLHPFRRQEALAFKDIQHELEALESLAKGTDLRSGLTALRHYHHRRITAAPRLVALLQQGQTGHG